MKRTNISIPDDLLDRLRARPDLNWSRICVDALEAALGGESVLLVLRRLEERVKKLEQLLDKIMRKYKLQE